ncbi:MAG: hypothetical protein GY862_34115 [Gammaproteobacteria bacterium]|nr:hypothetical protein [Gammaproteobacteria bacterium]
MQASLFITGISCFLFAFIVHMAVWRIWPSGKDISRLFLIFICLPFLPSLIAAQWLELSPFAFFAMVLLWFALSAAYIQTYPALKEDIPSFRLLFLIDDSGPQGINRENLLGKIGGDDLFLRKIDELEKDGLILEKDGKLELSRAGRFLSSVFYYYRRILGLQPGEG